MKLIYFKTRGRAEPIRLLCALGKIPVTDQYLNNKADWLAAPKPYGQVPVLELENGEVLTQTKSILGYLGRKYGFYPTGDLAIARTDEIVEAAFDLSAELGKAFTADKSVRPGFIANFKLNSARWLSVWEKLLVGKTFFMGDKPTVADVLAFKAVEDLVMYIGEADAVGPYPEVTRWRKNFGQIKEIAEYMQSERRLPFPMTEDAVAETFKYYGSVIRGD